MQVIRVEDAEAQFETVIVNAQLAPVHVQKDGQDVAVVLSPKLYAALLAEPPPNVNPRIAALFKRSLVERASLYRALARYEAEHPEVDED